MAGGSLSGKRDSRLNRGFQWQSIYQQWLENKDLDEKTRAELASIQANPVEIRDRFDGELEFGTGGLRGIIGAGTRRMNRYVIGRATQGLANYLLEKYSHVEEKKAAITYDSRHYSREFAEETALVLAANGIKALLFREMRPTPQLSFAIRELGCLAGVVITASHNPPQYNGYKVYGEDGGQAVPSLAEEITAAIKKVDYFKGIKLISKEEALKKGLLEYIGEEMDEVYLNKIKSLAFMPGDSNLKIVYSPLHGTGAFLIPRLLEELGYTKVFVVEKQAQPDPDFPTVKVPNPEEKESFELAFKLAQAKKADLVLATDPDADRVGCAVKDEKGRYIPLNGNQVGALLVDYLLKRLKEKGELPPNGAIVKTIVTGDLGKKIAASYGVQTVETLTGFKYIAEQIKRFEEKGERHFLFGYEESYGYLAGTFVRDKDAVIASALITEMASYYRQGGKDLLQVLEELSRSYGYHLEELESFELKDLSLAAKILSSFRNEPLEKLNGFQVVVKRDYSQQKAWDLKRGKTYDLSLPRSDVLFFELEGDAWFCIRPSGTEPKIKIYFSVTAGSKKEGEKKMRSLKNSVMARIQQAI